MFDFARNKLEGLIAGLFLLLLALAVMVPLPLDETWDWGPFSFLSFVIGIPLFTIGLILMIDSFRTEPHQQNLPLIDEWICEEGTEQKEIFQINKDLKQGEKLLAIAASRGDKLPNRLAVTNKRIILYSTGDTSQNQTIAQNEIVAATKHAEKLLPHLGEIRLQLKTAVITFKKVDFDHGKQVVDLINRLRKEKELKRLGTTGS